MNIDKCPTCKTYHIKKKNQIALVEKGTIEEGHHFAVRYAELTPDPALWIWPDECCICGALPEKYEELRLNLGQAQMAGLMTRVTFWNVPVPYCKSHKFGVRWNSDPSMNEPDDGRINGIALCFNSFDYMLHFKTLNSLR
ncbi:MAG: hypothetical protein HY064_09660 [Bacteroidetes bacterium]|nr:hypothetical protein [Bacteroidota bacterium]